MTNPAADRDVGVLSSALPESLTPTTDRQRPVAVSQGGRKGLALGLILLAQLLVILDVSIVNLALPTIGLSLRFSAGGLQWVLTAYALVFGGFLLLGGRAADLFGRRRVLMVGVGVFTAASLVCGLATSAAVLLAARAAAGLGGAMIAPAALSLVLALFPDGAQRNKALGAFSAVGAAGGAVGLLAGGTLTTWLGWRSIFFVSVPIGMLILAAACSVLPKSRVELARRRIDISGALTSTGGLSLLVYTVVASPTHTAALTILLLVGSAAALGAFLLIEARSAAPLLPLSFFGNRTAAGANVVGLLIGGPLFAMFFLLSLYLQTVQRYSALRTGLGFLLICVVIIAASGLAQMLVTKVGVRAVLAAGMLLCAGAQLLFTNAPEDGGFVALLLPGFLLVGVGLGFAVVANMIAATASVSPTEAGLASGLINTSQQVGGAIAIAVTSTIVAARSAELLASGQAPAAALTSGFHAAFAVLASAAAAGALLTLVVIRAAPRAR